MTAQGILKELKSIGTEQNRKVYARHGAQEPMFGVSFANLSALAKKIKKDHVLARELWASGNHDARILATMIADPQQADDKLLDTWATHLNSYVVTDAFSKFVAQTPLARRKADQWKDSDSDFLGQAGWILVGCLAAGDGSGLDDYFRGCLKTIETQIHGRKNRTRHAMNMALISIGLYNDSLRPAALAAAGRIGTVHVDHGQTGCRTPDAAEYIKRAASRQAGSVAARKSESRAPAKPSKPKAAVRTRR